MKKLFAIFTVSLFASTILLSCGPSSDDAIKYNNDLVEQRTKVIEKENALTEAISKNMPEKLDILYSEMNKQIDESIEAVNKMYGFDGKTDMKDAVMKLLTTYKEVAGSEYKEMLKYTKIPDSLYTQEEDDKVMELSKKIDDKLNKVDDDFIQAQKLFAEKYQFVPTAEVPIEKEEIKSK